MAVKKGKFTKVAQNKQMYGSYKEYQVRCLHICMCLSDFEIVYEMKRW